MKKYDLTDAWLNEANRVYNIFTGSSLNGKPNRSSIGKKAYRTFLKNGGKRDSQGRFSGYPEVNLEDLYGPFEVESIIRHARLKEYLDECAKKQIEKIQVDWEKIGSQLWEDYVQNAGSVDNINNAKAFAKVFKKHNLLKEGVEI